MTMFVLWHTDLPLVVSQEYVAIIDPHRRCIHNKSETAPAGTRKKLTKFFKHSGHSSTFESIFGLDTKYDTYKGTIFRFPLRQSGANSEISNEEYDPKMIQDKLFESIKKESAYILLFLKNVTSISLLEWKSSASLEPSLTFKIEVVDKSSTNAGCKEFARQCSEYYEANTSEVYLQLKSKTVIVKPFSGIPQVYHWLVLNVGGSIDTELNQLGKELSILPWVGIATLLPGSVVLESCDATLSVPMTDSSALESALKQFEGKLNDAKLFIKWSDDLKNIAIAFGHAFCFLPLPECTTMPVHVHGYFAVTDNRRGIKWPAHDEKGKEALWNKELLYKVVAPSYALLLACRSGLIHYQESPLPVTNTENVTDAYSTWPQWSEVKNIPIWNELVIPMLNVSSSLPLLWTPASGGKFVPFTEAHFLPGSCGTSNYHCNPVVVRSLLKLDFPVVSLPRQICETVRHSVCLSDIVLSQEISPSFVRKAIKNALHHCLSLSKQDIYDMLGYVLSDLNESNHAELIGLPLLPLNGISKPLLFEKQTQHNSKYIFPVELKSQIELLPGLDHLIVDLDMPKEITDKINKVTISENLNLRQASTIVICEELLPISVKTWCTNRSGTPTGWKWTPGVNGHPPLSWLQALWKWIAEKSITLSMLVGLPIVPLLQSNDQEQGETVTLIELSKTINVCRMPTLKDRIILTSILRKLDFVIADVSKMNHCEKMQDHPCFQDFIPELSVDLELIIKHLNRLSIATRSSCISSLSSDEKDFLRRQFGSLSEFCVTNQYRSCLQSIPIFHAACLDSQSSHFIPLVGSNGEGFLPPDGIPSLPEYPSNMLSTNLSSEDKYLFKALSVKQLTLSELCKYHVIPSALKHISVNFSTWSVGDELVLWILKQDVLPEDVSSLLSQHNFVFMNNSCHTKPINVYNPNDQPFLRLFDPLSDSDQFPDTRYMQHERALRVMGMKTWKSFQENPYLMQELFFHRMKSVPHLSISDQIHRGRFILQHLAELSTYRTDISWSTIPFLRARSCPTSYPPYLQRKWFGQFDKLYSISELCIPISNMEEIAGTVKPFLAQDYCRQYSITSFGDLPFQSINGSDVLKHLKNIESSSIGFEDAEKCHQMIMSAYEYLLNHSSGSCQLQSIWWKEGELQQFMNTQQFVPSLPVNLNANLEPYFYCLRRTSLQRYASLFSLKSSLEFSDVSSVLRKIKSGTEQSDTKLTCQQVNTCVSILNWLCENDYKESDMLMLTKDNKLVSVTRCVYDDRSWLKDTKSREQITSKSLTLVHDDISSKLAKHFHVKPLSRIIAPSERLSISYQLAGQHELITHRIRHIVQDYKTNIDIFKELIQNADDTGATEVKFLIDWRKHPTNKLLTDQLQEWQGPALIAYNNAMFSDPDDFENICKVAGETKKDDPLKIGRFGVGFCATYHVTDLPSFISRKYFTMFDPHTKYLGDRVSAQQPGMRVDLVENIADLELYEDQFLPYKGLFGCRVFDLKDDGYQGTLFRFPFRSKNTAEKSDICKKIFDKQNVSDLVKALKEQSGELLLFLKNITMVSLYDLQEGDNPSKPHKLFSVQRMIGGNQMERVDLLKNYRAKQGVRTCSCKCNIEVHEGSKKLSSTTWFLSSAIGGCSVDILQYPEAKSLLPLAEVAVKMEPSKEGSYCLPSHYDSKHNNVFCFLPLPISSQLPFHVNGVFSIGKERRSISATDDGTFGSLWNKSLAEGPLVKAFVCLLKGLSSEFGCNLRGLSSQDDKDKYLHDYYSLCDFRSTENLIGKSFVASFKQKFPCLASEIVWSEVSNGCWLSPARVKVFKDSTLSMKDTISTEKQIIQKDAISLLLCHGHEIVNIPDHIYEIMDQSLCDSKRLFNYQRFCIEVLFPNITNLDPEVRDRNIMFLLEKFGTRSYTGRSDWCSWAKDFLQHHPCISCQESDVLRPASQLIDPRNPSFKKLFEVREGRFPSKIIQNSEYAMRGLCSLGMASSKLNIQDLKERAKSVSTMEYGLATQRSASICEYINSAFAHVSLLTFHSTKDASLQELQEICNIPFLPAMQTPDDVNVPWYGKPEVFYSPSQVYPPECAALVFSQYPLVKIDSAYAKALLCLKISLRKPTLDAITAHLACLSKGMKNEPSKETVAFLDDSMKELYAYLEANHMQQHELEQLCQTGNFIWQDGHFLTPQQVVVHWNHSCAPYLCELSSYNKRCSKLMEKVGVKSEVSLEMLEDVLQRIADEHSNSPLSDITLEFVEYVAGKLAPKIDNDDHDHSHKVYLPDEQRIMRNVSNLADNMNVNSEFVKRLDIYQQYINEGVGYFVHEDIPRHTAVTLGVKPLLEAVLEEIEDENFLSGSDFGQHEDLCDRLNGILRKYPADVSILKEFIQNADDAKATEIVFVLDHRTNYPDATLLSSKSSWKSLQHTLLFVSSTIVTLQILILKGLLN